MLLLVGARGGRICLNRQGILSINQDYCAATSEFCYEMAADLAVALPARSGGGS